MVKRLNRWFAAHGYSLNMTIVFLVLVVGILAYGFVRRWQFDHSPTSWYVATHQFVDENSTGQAQYYDWIRAGPFASKESCEAAWSASMDSDTACTRLIDEEAESWPRHAHEN